ncbi:sensor histidine kinase [Lentzea flaviverrucosa]|uniref:histidine kinase n=1 Tax=Lentzea flaviverrucosa TaxID=200379 RepID=A0A1H9XBA2_9PSEU|nr:histidine kinase [Lentzea flaviverrucosa]RDI21645.1 signal transduction histidine kinase [Lentzea flaviverrucosa]SES43415.1 Signal transduction histidine kinase [Lentzea flaviverrucosa]
MIARLHLYLVDLTAALVIGVLVAYAMVENQDKPWWLVLPGAALVALPVAVRRLWPVATLVVTTLATVAVVIGQVLPVQALGAPMGAICFALYTVAVERPRSWSLTGLVVTVVASSGVSGGEAETVLVGIAVLGAVWVIGYTTRLRRSFLDRETAQRTEQALADERMRIARELHDVVAHNLSLITVQAANAAHVRSPEHAYEALRVISETSRAALTEMRGLLGVLRSDAGLAPSPGLGGLAGLADRASLAGVRVTLDVRGDAAVPEGLGLSAYRIVQEALTNVVKHAAPASCKVLVDVTPEAVRVEVADDGPGVKELGVGHGLIGMRERVAVYGGTFSAGPGSEGGFRVVAELPQR